MGTFFRTPEMQAKYDALKQEGHLTHGCPLCDAPSLHEFTYWRIIDNRFPYDKISDVHHMLVPLRHTIESALSKEEHQEMLMLKDTYLGKEYAYMLEALAHQKSIPQHIHFHLLIPKEF